MKFYKQYKLKKELPDFPRGTILKWDYWFEEYTEFGAQAGTRQKTKLNYTKDYIESKPDWFEPIGKQFDFYSPFPSENDFFDRDNGHYYLGSLRHNNMCNVCKTIKKLEFEKELKELIYNLIKQKYNKFINNKPLCKNSK